MEAGKELDALIMEKVMGDEPLKGRVAYLNPSYSIDINAAWEVVEKMKEKGLTVEVFFGWESNKYQKDDWVAIFEDSNGEYLGVAKTAPNAICLAALKALESEK